jgi:hypothetical protein
LLHRQDVSIGVSYYCAHLMDCLMLHGIPQAKAFLAHSTKAHEAVDGLRAGQILLS